MTVGLFVQRAVNAQPRYMTPRKKLPQKVVGLPVSVIARFISMIVGGESDGAMCTDEDPTIWVCQGPPVCDLMDNDAVAAQQARCIWCRRVIIHEDGTETVIEPSRQ